MSPPTDDDDLLSSLPKRPAGKKLVPEGKRPSPPMLRLIRIARALGILLGGFVTVVSLMSLVGLLTDVFWVRLLVALLVGLALPALVADRVLKKTSIGGGAATVVDIFAIVLLTLGMLFVGLDSWMRSPLVLEGDRYARSGSTVTARAVYFVAGVAPTFPSEGGWRGEIPDAGPGTFLRLDDGGLVSISAGDAGLDGGAR